MPVDTSELEEADQMMPEWEPHERTMLSDLEKKAWNEAIEKAAKVAELNGGLGAGPYIAARIRELKKK